MGPSFITFCWSFIIFFSFLFSSTYFSLYFFSYFFLFFLSFFFVFFTSFSLFLSLFFPLFSFFSPFLFVFFYLFFIFFFVNLFAHDTSVKKHKSCFYNTSPLSDQDWAVTLFHSLLILTCGQITWKITQIQIIKSCLLLLLLLLIKYKILWTRNILFIRIREY